MNNLLISNFFKTFFFSETLIINLLLNTFVSTLMVRVKFCYIPFSVSDIFSTYDKFIFLGNLQTTKSMLQNTQFLSDFALVWA